MRTRVLPACNRLDHLPPDEVEAKRRALAAVRPAFVLVRVRVRVRVRVS